MKDFNLKKYLAEGKLLKEEVDVNKILSDGGYDEIDDEELLMTVKSRLKGNSNIDAEKLNLLVMKIEDEEGGNIDFSEGRLLKEDAISKLKSKVKDMSKEEFTKLAKRVGDLSKFKMASKGKKDDGTPIDPFSNIDDRLEVIDQNFDEKDAEKYLAEGKLLKEEQMGSYTKFLKVIKSYEDEEILKDFLDSYPKGQDISKSEYDKFTEKHFGLADPEDYRGKNWKYIMSENKLLKEGLKLEQNPFDQQGLFLSNDGGRSGVFITTDLDFDITDYEMDGDEERGDLNGIDVRIISVYG